MSPWKWMIHHDINIYSWMFPAFSHHIPIILPAIPPWAAVGPVEPRRCESPARPSDCPRLGRPEMAKIWWVPSSKVIGKPATRFGLNPSEKYESQLGWLFPIYGKIKNVPNHQPIRENNKMATKPPTRFGAGWKSSGKLPPNPERWSFEASRNLPRGELWGCPASVHRVNQYHTFWILNVDTISLVLAVSK